MGSRVLREAALVIWNSCHGDFALSEQLQADPVLFSEAMSVGGLVRRIVLGISGAMASGFVD